MRVRGPRDLKIVREGENVFTFLDRVSNSPGVCFCTLEFGADVGFVRKRSRGHKGQRGERSNECLFHFRLL